MKPSNADHYKSNLERRYALWLDSQKSRGEIRDWTYEALKLRIGPVGENAWYTPDFLVTATDGRQEIHETKGYRERAGVVRFKAAAEIHKGFRFVLVEQMKNEWKSKEF